MNEAPASPPPIESLADRTKRFLMEIVSDWIKIPITEVGFWMRDRVTRYAIGLVLICVAIVFLLVGGVQGFQQLLGPKWLWVPYVGLGTIAAMVGIFVMKSR